MGKYTIAFHIIVAQINIRNFNLLRTTQITIMSGIAEFIANTVIIKNTKTFFFDSKNQIIFLFTLSSLFLLFV